MKVIRVGNSNIKINDTTRKEYLNSRYSKKLKNKKHLVYADKLRTAGSIKDVVIATTDYINEAPKHNNFKNFARGSVLLQIGNSQYEAEVVVGITSAGNTVLYDIVDINKTVFGIKKVSIPSGTNNNDASQIDGYAHNNSISENNSVVNSNSMQESENDAKKAAFEATTVNIDIIHREYAGYTKEQIYSLKKVGKAFNVDVMIGSDAKFSSNGYYVRSHNGERAKIYLNAGGTNPLNAVIRHEIIHHIKAQSQNAYNAFSTYITNSYKEKNGQEAFDIALNEIAETYKTNTGKELTYDEAVEEFCADVGMDMFRSPEEARKFAFENRKLAEKVRDAIREVLRKISSVFRNEWDYSFDRLSSLESTATVGKDGQVYHSHNTASESLNTFDVETLKEAERVLTQALKHNASNNNSVIGRESTVSYSATNDLNNYTYDALTQLDDMQIIDVSDIIPKNGEGKVDRNKIRENGMQNAFENGEKITDKLAVVQNKYTKQKIAVRTSAISHSLDRRSDVAVTAQKVGDLLKNAVPVNEMEREEHANIIKSYPMIAVAQNEMGKKYAVLMIVNDVDGRSPELAEIRVSEALYSLNAKKELAVHSTRGPSVAQDARKSLTSSTITITHLLDFVKDYFPDVLSNDVLSKYGMNKNPNSKYTGMVYSATSNIAKNEIAEDSESLISIEEYNKNSEYIPSNKKAQNKYNSTVNAMLRKAESLFSVPHGEAVAHIKPIIKEMAAKLVNRKGNISDDEYFNLTLELIGRAQYIDSEFYDMYKDLKKTLRNTPISVNDSVKNSFSHWNDFRKSTMGVLTISNEGMPLDSVYNELSDNYPEFFPKDVYGEDQLYKLLEVAKNIKVVNRGYAEYFGDNAEEMAHSMMTEFKRYIQNEIAPELSSLERYDAEIKGKIAAANDFDVENFDIKQAMNNSKQANALRKKIQNAMNKNVLTQRDKLMIKRIVGGEMEYSDLPERVPLIKTVFTEKHKSIKDLHIFTLLLRIKPYNILF